jgi:hypothetical protein
MKEEVPIRIRVLDPPRDVLFGVQRGRTEIVAPTEMTSTEVRFDLSLRVGDGRADGLPNFLGPFAQGPPACRFVYVNSGTLAGQSDSCWTRRAKVHLAGITWAMVEGVLTGSADLLEARIVGTGRDGGPACATVPLVDGGWRTAKKR